MFYDFSFNGVESSLFEMKIGYVGNKNDNDIAVLEYETEYNKRKNDFGFGRTKTTIKEPLKIDDKTLSLVKVPCKNGNEFYTRTEMDEIARWLTSSKHGELILHTIGDNGSTFDLKLNGLFTKITEITQQGKYLGYTLNFESDSAFAHLDTVIFEDNTPSKTFELPLLDIDFAALEYLYPIIKITIKEDGDLEFVNNSDGNTVKIENCTANEEIIIDSANEIIKSSKRDNLYREYNYIFPKLVNDSTYVGKGTNSFSNEFESNLDCTLKIAYVPLRLGVGIFG